MLQISRLVAAAIAVTSLLAPSAYAEDATGAANPPDTSPGQTQGAATAPPKVVQGTVTGYASGGSGGIGTMTASGVQTHWGTVAADWRLYPLGTRLQIEGFPSDVFTVEDSGSAVRGNVFDVWFPDPAMAVAFGTKSLRVTVLGN
jgi:3D (Asp-Asp-Asp) domain-containing protein